MDQPERSACGNIGGRLKEAILGTQTIAIGTVEV
jgi:hypothetical protein